MQSWDNEVANYWGTVSVNTPIQPVPINCPIVGGVGGGLGSWGGGGGGGEGGGGGGGGGRGGYRIAHNTISDTLFLYLSVSISLFAPLSIHMLYAVIA